MKPAHLWLTIGLVLLGAAGGCNAAQPAAPATVAIAMATRLPAVAQPAALPSPVTPSLAARSTLPATETGSMATSQEIAFQTLSQGDSYTAGLEGPALFVAANREATNPFTGWLEPNQAASLQGVDFAKALVVAVFRGKVGSSGYGLAVQRVELTGNTVHLFVKLTEPAAGQNVSDIITYPYHIILLPRSKLQPHSGLSWIISTMAGELLYQEP